ncbi:hemolysin XhlA family protein [Clostridium intestinale]|uniref:Haemolysin XhlA n=1 Tax=Clostridium intestinale DSM 6191 TaxID=1121320 RepID=A0A1M5V1J9_9CLOT|nr:hemolysin XhlA family protein [Clostridium intestinale]SHH69111.1 Haemolysin XhlA [Clostridium intestinale DSM 6191]
MNEELCLERHKRITEKLDEHERRINKHGERLDSLDKDSVELKTEIKNLCKQIGSLTAILKWFIGLLVGSFVAFFFYAVQQNIFK